MFVIVSTPIFLSSHGCHRYGLYLFFFFIEKLCRVSNADQLRLEMVDTSVVQIEHSTCQDCLIFASPVKMDCSLCTSIIPLFILLCINSSVLPFQLCIPLDPTQNIWFRCYCFCDWNGVSISFTDTDLPESSECAWSHCASVRSS